MRSIMLCIHTRCAPVQTKKVIDSLRFGCLRRPRSPLLSLSPQARFFPQRPQRLQAPSRSKPPRTSSPLLARSGERSQVPRLRSWRREGRDERRSARGPGVYLDLHSHRCRTPARGALGARGLLGTSSAGSGHRGARLVRIPAGQTRPWPLRAAPSLLPAPCSRHVRSPLPPAPSGTRELPPLRGRFPTALS